MTTDLKPWWKSKTLWVNGAAAVVMAVEEWTGAFQPFFPANVYATIALALAGINAVLRVITDQGIKI